MTTQTPDSKPRALIAMSGGVDSSVAAALLQRAVGDQLTCIFVDHGLLRKDEGDQVEQVMKHQFHVDVRRVNAGPRFLSKLAGVSEPERKRKIIGEEFIRVFEEEAKKIGKVDTMEAFREQVRKQLYDGKHASALNRAKDQILTQLAAAAEGELPSVLVESTYQHEMENIQQQLQMQRMSLDRYLSQIHQTRETFTANVHAAAENNTRARMALLQVAQQENLVPTDEEINKNLQERADRTKKTLEEVKAGMNIPMIQRNEAIRRAADWVIEHSTIEEKDA